MSRRAKGPRLWLRPARRDDSGTLTHAATWFILDGTSQCSTGLGIGATAEEKDRALKSYLTDKYASGVAVGLRDPSRILIDDVLTLYVDDVVARHARPDETGKRIAFLRAFWAGRALDSVTGATCRAYVKQRSTSAAARRELEDLRAAINHHRAEGLHDRIVSVKLPDKAPARERWLTRAEAAVLIWNAWRFRETDTQHGGFRGVNTIRQGHRTYYYAWRDGPRIHAPFGTQEFAAEYAELVKDKPRDRWPRRHLARFMVVARYMGARASIICSASIERKRPADRPWIDLTTGIFYGRPEGERETKKRRQRVRVPTPLLAHLRRWRAHGQRYAVEWRGEPVLRVTKAHDRTVHDVGLGREVTPHVWRHTAVTWALQGGAPIWRVAKFFGLTAETVERVYGHHCPTDSFEVHDAFASSRRQRIANDKSEQKATLKLVSSQ